MHFTYLRISVTDDSLDAVVGGIFLETTVISVWYTMTLKQRVKTL